MVSSSEKTVRRDQAPATGAIRSVEKVIDILELLSRESRGMALGDLASRLGMNASTAHHLLATLKGRGIVIQDERTKAYRIGYSLVGLVNRFLAGTELYPAGIGPIEELRDLSGETSYFSAFQGREVSVIISLTGARPVQARRFHRQGQSNLHSTATGKLLLARLPREEALAILNSRVLAQFTPNTITDPARLLDELQQIRTQGFAVDREEDYVGVECVAMPVFAANGECVAAASVSYPAASPERNKELTQLVASAAAKISTNLGGGSGLTLGAGEGG
jgi:IclR family acetate operon transcriptional repressor